MSTAACRYADGGPLCANVTETAPLVEMTVEGEQDSDHVVEHVEEERHRPFTGGNGVRGPRSCLGLIHSRGRFVYVAIRCRASRSSLGYLRAYRRRRFQTRCRPWSLNARPRCAHCLTSWSPATALTHSIQDSALRRPGAESSAPERSWWRPMAQDSDSPRITTPRSISEV
jgi:hypothetical protein